MPRKPIDDKAKLRLQLAIAVVGLLTIAAKAIILALQ